MPIEVTAPDGSVVSFPDNTDTGTIHSVMSQHWGKTKPSAGKPQGFASQGLPEGFVIDAPNRTSRLPESFIIDELPQRTGGYPRLTPVDYDPFASQ